MEAVASAGLRQTAEFSRLRTLEPSTWNITPPPDCCRTYSPNRVAGESLPRLPLVKPDRTGDEPLYGLLSHG